MTSQTLTPPEHPSDLLELLTASKKRLVEFSTGLAAASRWDEAQSAIEWAKLIDGMIAALERGNGTALRLPARDSQISARSRAPRREDLPYYYVEGDKLVKVGASRDDSTYKHRVTRKNFDLVLEELCRMATTDEFETQTLVARCGIPHHEPRIIVDVLERDGLLISPRRGRWRFVHPRSFSERAAAVWQRLPRNE